VSGLVMLGTMWMTKTPNGETYSEEETERRVAAALKRMLATKPAPHKPPSNLS
jgi:hypothetical protein